MWTGMNEEEKNGKSEFGIEWGKKEVGITDSDIFAKKFNLSNTEMFDCIHL